MSLHLVSTLPHTNAVRACPFCEGCGQVSDGPRPVPWRRWLHAGRFAFTEYMLGLVNPCTCLVCHGAGWVAS